MSFLKRLFGPKLDGQTLARSPERSDYAQIGLLATFVDGAPTADAKRQQAWSRALPRSYAEQIDLFVQQGWLASDPAGYRVTAQAMPFVASYQQRLDEAKTRVMATVRAALIARDTGEALEIRRRYEASFPLGEADWTGPQPQPSRSALTRRILYLNHWLLNGLSPETVEWLKLYAAEEHLWGAYWRMDPDDIPDLVRAEVTPAGLDSVEAVYWRAWQLALFVDNQETWQRCKGGDHVRRIEVLCTDDEFTCDHCRAGHGQQYLVDRTPELPHRECTSLRGCRCRYEPVLESYDGLAA